LISLSIFPKKIKSELSEMFDINKIVIKLFEQYNEINDYQCRVRQWCIHGTKYEKRIMNFYFSRPRNIRVEILRGNRMLDQGTIGIYTGGNKITGKQMGFVIQVDKKNPLVTTVRGVPFDQTDLEAILNRIQLHAEKSEGKVIKLRRKKICISFTPRNPSDFEGITRELVWIDLNSWLPEASESYDNSQLVQYVEWKHYIINQGLPGELFVISFSSKQLKKMGLTSIDDIPVNEDF
ncbi:MAG: hypothetical protein MJB14_04475, partial [Spirochaetes bacterium]|nr:hypothetical protein [Spirochaetota bacterium]